MIVVVVAHQLAIEVANMAVVITVMDFVVIIVLEHVTAHVKLLAILLAKEQAKVGSYTTKFTEKNY